jgi:hypothetical protein
MHAGQGTNHRTLCMCVCACVNVRSRVQLAQQGTGPIESQHQFLGAISKGVDDFTVVAVGGGLRNCELLRAAVGAGKRNLESPSSAGWAHGARSRPRGSSW